MDDTTENVPLWERSSVTDGELRKVYQSEYTAWTNMRSRAKDGKYSYSEEFDDFRDFLHHVGAKPAPSYSLDRIDPSDPEYAPGKVRWATKREQSNNRGNTVSLTYSGQKYPKLAGQTLPLTEWAEICGCSPATLRRRRGNGWSDNEVIDGTRESANKPFEHMTEGELLNYKPWETDRAQLEEKRYLLDREPNEDRFDFLMRVLVPEWREDLIWRGTGIAFHKKHQSRGIDVVPEGEVVGDWQRFDTTSVRDFELLCEEQEDFYGYVRDIKKERNRWYNALQKFALKREQVKANDELKAKIKRELPKRRP